MKALNADNNGHTERIWKIIFKTPGEWSYLSKFLPCTMDVRHTWTIFLMVKMLPYILNRRRNGLLYQLPGHKRGPQPSRKGNPFCFTDTSSQNQRNPFACS